MYISESLEIQNVANSSRMEAKCFYSLLFFNYLDFFCSYNFIVKTILVALQSVCQLFSISGYTKL
jgi:hypothetical protein